MTKHKLNPEWPALAPQHDIAVVVFVALIIIFWSAFWMLITLIIVSQWGRV